MNFDSIFSAQDLKVTVRDMNVKFGRDAAWYVHLGHAKYYGHMTITERFDQGSVLSSVSNVSALICKENKKNSIWGQFKILLLSVYKYLSWD